MLTIVNLYSSSMKCLDACSFIIYCIFGFEGSSYLEPVSSVKTISVAFLWKAVSDELGNMWIYGPCRLILGRSKSSLRYYSHSEATDTIHFKFSSSCILTATWMVDMASRTKGLLAGSPRQ